MFSYRTTIATGESQHGDATATERSKKRDKNGDSAVIILSQKNFVTFGSNR